MVVQSNIEPENPLLRKLWVILNTSKGTIPLFRDLGISSSIIDMKITEIPSIISQDLDIQLKKYIPELSLKKIKAELKHEKIILHIEVEKNA